MNWNIAIRGLAVVTCGAMVMVPPIDWITAVGIIATAYNALQLGRALR